MSGPKPAYRLVDGKGYIEVYEPNHPNAMKNGRVLEHRKVVSDFLGRPLRADEEVHHKDRNKLNNDISNLELTTKAAHTSLHKREIAEPVRQIDTERLRQWYNEVGATKIGEHFGLTDGTVRSVLREKGIPIHKPGHWKTQELIARFFELPPETVLAQYRELGILKLGKKYGISSCPVRDYLSKHGIGVELRGVCRNTPRKKNKVRTLPKDELQRLYDTHTMPELAEKFGCAVSTVLLAMTGHGIATKPRGRPVAASAVHKPAEQTPTPRQTTLDGVAS